MIGAVIPAFDAESSVGDIVRRTRNLIEQVLVVDDGSRDRTAEAARAAGARVIVHPHNRGKGCALRTGFDDLFARGCAEVVTLDADGQHLPEEIPKLRGARAEGADLVLGSRSALFAQMCGRRRLANRMSSRMISFAAGQALEDVQTGFRLYTQALIAATGFPEHRFEAESAVVVRAVRLGFKVLLVPIELGFADGRCTSHYRPIVDSVRIACAVTRARFEFLG